MLASTVYAQNLVPNASFEELKSSAQNSPTAPDQLEDLKEWKRFETSDLVSSDPTKYNKNYAPLNDIMNAHTGSKFLGFGPCEGGQVKLTSPIQEMQWVTVSFWFSPQKFVNSEINVYLLEDQAPNDALDDCFNPNIEYEVNFKLDVNGSNAFGAPEHVPGTWYKYTSEPQLVANTEYKWLAIKGENIAGDGSSSRYVFVDDIEVRKYGFCDHICSTSGTTDDIEFTNVIPDGMVGNTGVNFFTTIKNANHVEFYVWNLFGELAYYWNSFDLNGLVDPGFSDFALIWNGNSTLTGNDMITETAYPMRIIARSCVDTVVINNVINLVAIADPPAVPYDETQNRQAPDCCPDFEYIQNTTYTDYASVNVDDFIIAGENVTAGPTGPVIVSNSADVRYRAGNNIDLQPGFSVSPGGLFAAKIEPCGASPKTNIFNNRAYYESLRKEKEGKGGYNEDMLSHIYVSPNPNNGLFDIMGLSEEHTSLEILDMFGTIHYYQELRSRTTNMSLPHLKAGMYMVKVFGNRGECTYVRVTIL